MAEFFDMGGYAKYVWSAFGVTGVALVLMYCYARSAHAKAIQRAARFLATHGDKQ